MDQSWKDAIAALECAADLTSAPQHEMYLQSISQLREYRDPQLLRRMLLCLRDTDAGEVQYELLEACEAYPLAEYISGFVDVAEELYGRSPDWFDVAFRSICNSEAYWAALRLALGNRSARSKQFLVSRLEELAARRPRYVPRLQDMRLP